MLLEALKANAIQRGFLNSADTIDLEKAFLLLRDLP
jgi:hypothetical protein